MGSPAATEPLAPPRGNGLSIRLIGGLVMLITLICGVTFVVIWVQGRPLLEMLSQREQTQLGINVTLALGQRTRTVEGIARSMAQAAIALPKQDPLFIATFPPLLNQLGKASEIAGGGIWPEAYTFDGSHKLHSFFWGRDLRGELKFFDDYNDPEGTPYQGAEWYAPARLVEKTGVYWSRSYTDPYSLQPMVTCTAPMWDKGLFVGVATVDLMLDEISKIVSTLVNGDAYAFVVDRNNKFIAFPQPKRVLTTREIAGKMTPDFIYTSELANKDKRFVAMAEALDRLEYQQFMAMREHTSNHAQYTKELEFTSHQIDQNEARRIASHLWTVKHKSGDYPLELARFEVDDDMILGEKALVTVFQMPETNWKVVTVFKRSQHTIITDAISLRLLLSLSAATVLFGCVAYMALKRSVLLRLNRMSGQLQKAVEGADNGYAPLLYDHADEIGALVYWFNRRSLQVEASRQQAQQANQAKTDFLAKMSHELRTPLNSIIGFSRRLLKHLNLTADKRHGDALQSIYRSALQQLDLINDILDHSAIESGTVKLRLTHESVNELITTVAVANHDLVTSKGLQFKVAKLTMDKQIYCDKNKVRQVLSNLISNAVKATQQGLISLTVDDSVLHGRAAISFTVVDTGVGISAEDCAKLFKPFSQLDKRICVPGTGLGLFLARYYTDMHGGLLELENQHEQSSGARFVATFPISGPVHR